MIISITPPEPFEPVVPRLLGDKYRIGRLIAETNSSRIYQATQESLERSLAIRLFKSDVGAKEHELLVTEARLCAQLDHPNVVQIYELGIDEEQPFVAMELLVGDTLRQRVEREGHAELEELARFGEELLGALLTAHDSGAMHRGLSAASVRLTRRRDSDVVKIADFIPRRDRDARTDLYAAGVALYEALTGALPFAAASNGGGFADLPRGPSEARDDVGLDADAFTMRALATNPVSRFQTAEEMMDAWCSIAAFGPYLST